MPTGLVKVFHGNLDRCWIDEVQVRSQGTEPAIEKLCLLSLTRLHEPESADKVIGKVFEYLHGETPSEKQILKEELDIRKLLCQLERLSEDYTALLIEVSPLIESSKSKY